MRYFLILFSVAFMAIACTKDDCTRPDRCSEKPDPGPCEAYIPSYFFNEETGKCEEFIYGGCGGNQPYANIQACYECECDKRLE